jgi:hypothetical protein
MVLKAQLLDMKGKGRGSDCVPWLADCNQFRDRISLCCICDISSLFWPR